MELILKKKKNPTSDICVSTQKQCQDFASLLFDSREGGKVARLRGQMFLIP
jgi:hypothetical protein